LSDPSDAFGRPILAEGMKAQVEAAFKAIPDGKRGALLIIADERGATAHVAARIGDHWKVAAGAGMPWQEKKASGWVSIGGAW
jgi:hypothetical protein